MKVLAAVLIAGLAGPAFADSEDIPLTEQGFVEQIKVSDKSRIIEHLGKPARAVDITDDTTGEVMGAIWHYYYLNTNDQGEFYKSTELDFVGDRVVTVVFSMMDDDLTDATQALPETSSPSF